jgi:hypothetical protein
MNQLVDLMTIYAKISNVTKESSALTSTAFVVNSETIVRVLKQQGYSTELLPEEIINLGTLVYDELLPNNWLGFEDKQTINQIATDSLRCLDQQGSLIQFKALWRSKCYPISEKPGLYVFKYKDNWWKTINDPKMEIKGTVYYLADCDLSNIRFNV